MVAPNDLVGQILNKLDPISKECISTTTLLVTVRSDMSLVLNTGQQLEVENDTGVGTVIDVKTLLDMDNKNSIRKNSNINMEMEIIFNYIENLSGQNKTSLRSRKCIIHSSNNQASLDNSTKLHQLCKRPSSTSSFVDSSIHKK